jgi:hypothetical protein
MLHRRKLTDAIKVKLVTTGFPVGIAQPPKNVAWEGQPNQDDSTFRPYSVLTPMNSGPATGSIDFTAQDWQLPYGLSSFGVKPEQTELIADEMREMFYSMKKTSVTLGDETYRILQVRIDSIGALQRVDATDPSYWGQTDGYSVWISKELT